MKNWFRATLSLLLSAVLVFSTLPTPAVAEMGEEAMGEEAAAHDNLTVQAGPIPQAEPTPQGKMGEETVNAPAEPTSDPTRQSNVTANGANGATPLDVHVPSIHDANGPLATQGADLPAAYDSRAANGRNLVTPVKNQSIYGICWAFSTIGALESSLLAQYSQLDASTLDLSERHLAYFVCHQQDDALHNITGDATVPKGSMYGKDKFETDPYLVSGGNYYVSAISLSSWAGAATEDKAAYTDLLNARKDYVDKPEWFYPPKSYGQISDSEKGASYLKATALDPSLARGCNNAWLTGFRLISEKDRDDIKSAIMDNGGVAVQVNASNDYLNMHYVDNRSTTLNLYDSDASTKTTHEVEVVGWDDNYDRRNFSKHKFVDAGNAEVPEEAASVELDVPVTVEPRQTYSGSKWLEFTPQTDGVYHISYEGSVHYVSAYQVSDVNGKLDYCRVLESDSPMDVELIGGRKCYLQYPMPYGDSGPATITVSRVGDIDLSDMPQSKGAWLAKNSWGENVWDSINDGYVWISYEDVCLQDDQMGTFIATTEQPYDNIYQYDGGTSTNANTIESGGSIANVFQAKANPGKAEKLSAVGLWLRDVNVDYEVQVYLNPSNPADPTSGRPALATPISGKTSYVGYYTFDLPEPLYLAEGTNYAVVATLSHADGTAVKYSVDANKERDWVTQKSVVAPNQSFERDAANATWDDLSSDKYDVNEPPEGTEENEESEEDEEEDENVNDHPCSCARIKAFTNNVERAIRKVAVPTATDRTYDGTLQVGVAAGDGYTLAGAYQATDAGDYVATASLGADCEWADGTTGEKQVAWKILPASITSVSVNPSSFTYDGKAKTPAVTVVAGSLEVSQDGYDVEYRDNMGPGTATVIVKGKGNYTGTKSATFQIAAPTRTFPDVSKDAWYAGVVSRAASLGLINGYKNGDFGPNDTITRGQVAVVLWNMAGHLEPGAGARDFADVKSTDYFYSAVRWASSRSVVSGYDNSRFGPNDNVTREQLAVMLGNYAHHVAGRLVAGSVEDYSEMGDAAKVSPWAVTSVGWCFKNGVLSGSGGNVMPQGQATRAEAAKMMVYLHDMLRKES